MTGSDAARREPDGDEPEEGERGRLYQILAPSTPADERTRVLKHGDTFAVFDRYGDVKPSGLGEEGLYHEGTRFLSVLLLELEGGRPFFLGSTVRDENDQLTVALTNPDLVREGRIRFGLGTIQISIRKFLWRGVCYQQFRIHNHGLEPAATWIALHYGADYRDIFEVRGVERAARGQSLRPAVTGDAVVLGYRGLDGVVRRTHLRFDPAPTRITASSARLDLNLRPREEAILNVAAGCEVEPAPLDILAFEKARAEAEADLQRHNSWCCHLQTSNARVNALIDRSLSDLHMMTTPMETGPYPYAGVPWFNTPFGRDGLITALECLWMRPGLARGVLAYLAAHQATGILPGQDAEPGKILHESRSGEMAALKEIPFGRYYGSVDATPLFVLLAGAYHRRTGDREFVESIWPNLTAALDWIDTFGDRDGDGFVEYHRLTEDGLLQQGWKDADDSVFHADGTIARGPIALCEVQGYVYAARLAGAMLAGMLGEGARAEHEEERAESLRRRFEESFWCEDLSTYALALDGSKQPCRVRASNAGQCLFTGIVSPERARLLARTLLSPESCSGWGIRTVATSEARYNPMAYHNGSVWPHDNALIAWGLSRYGLMEKTIPIFTGLFEASTYFDLHRLPELFCGFHQKTGEGPVPYPVACSPQAWAAASVLLLLQACLGLSVDGIGGEISFTRPRLPEFVRELRIHNLEVGSATVDLLLVRHEYDVGVNVLRRDGDVEIVVLK